MDLKEFEKKTVQYLKDCEKKFRLPNRAGLCVALNWKREEYFANRKEGPYADIIHRFEQSCENFWIQRLGSGTSQGAIFYLKNAFKQDWSEETTVKFVLPTPILGTAILEEAPAVDKLPANAQK